MQVFLQMLEDGTFQIHSFFETKPMIGLYGLRDRVQLSPLPPPSLAPRKNHEHDTDKTAPHQVVPFDSAQVGHARHEVFSSINGNHLEICKFEKVSDAGYRAVAGALEDYIRAATADVGGEG